MQHNEPSAQGTEEPQEATIEEALTGQAPTVEEQLQPETAEEKPQPGKVSKRIRTVRAAFICDVEVDNDSPTLDSDHFALTSVLDAVHYRLHNVRHLEVKVVGFRSITEEPKA